MRHITGMLVVTVVLAIAPDATAQGLCEPTETVQDCLNRVSRDRDEDKRQTLVTEETDAGRRTETGIDISGLASSISDFLPFLQVNGLLGSVTRDERDGIITISLNTPFIGSTGRNGNDNALQFRAHIDTTAEVFGPLRTLLPEENREGIERRLLDGRRDAENVTLEVSYNLTTRRLGRNFSLHKDTLDTLFAEALASVSTAQALYTNAVLDLANALPGVSFTKQSWSSLTPAQRQTIESGILAITEVRQTYQAALDAAIRQTGLDVYGQLVNNQPQLLVTASRSIRDDLFGPDVVTARVSFEMGLGNTLNAALDSFNGTCAMDAAACLKHYAAFAADPRRRAAIEAGSRLSLFAEFAHNNDYRFTLADPEVELLIDEATGWSAGVEYGRLVGVDDTGRASGRVDLGIEWERPSDDAIDSRFVASLTITKKLGDLSIPFGLVYANKERFLTGIDKGLGANVGVKFNLFPAQR